MSRNSNSFEYEQLEEKINDLLNCVERPVGKLTPNIPDTPASQRAILALYETLGRGL